MAFVAVTLACGERSTARDADSAATRAAPRAEHPRFTVDDRPQLLVHVPAHLAAGERVPLVLALSPTGDAGSMMRAWAAVGDRHRWIIAASKEFRNGIDYPIVFDDVNAELATLEASYAVDSTRIVLAGFSGGAMASHAYAGTHPAHVRAIVANTGMMEAAFMRDDYPRAKLAVFLASPSDFRYTEMQRDRAFLDAHGWTTTWLEFGGGHVLAPTASYEAAASWLAQQW